MDNNTSFSNIVDDYLATNETFDTPFTYVSSRIAFIIVYVTVFITCMIGKPVSNCFLFLLN